ncbi:MAG: hypothetical protein HY234_07000 [Acidobacteria bacterium]|nr:hypothetical protein [Acidobacteriota bacterium]
MKAHKRSPVKTIRSWKQARAVFEKWRKACAGVKVELKRPRVIDAVPIDFIRGEPVEGTAAQGTRTFRGRLIFYTNADVTIRRPSGAILFIDNYEIAAISDGKTHFEPLSRR